MCRAWSRDGFDVIVFILIPGEIDGIDTDAFFLCLSDLPLDIGGQTVVLCMASLVIAYPPLSSLICISSSLLTCHHEG
jgi:hypothetical protein